MIKEVGVQRQPGGFTLAPKMNGAKRSAETVGCKNELVRERSALEERTRASRGG
ncbi:hypothetical protein AHAS_Ahas19G0106500 [Arachis hypogaea]